MELYKSKHLTVILPEVTQRALLIYEAMDQGKLLIISKEQILNQLVTTPNTAIEPPCPCGYYGDSVTLCNCTNGQVSDHIYRLKKQYSRYMSVECVFTYQRHIKVSGFDEMAELLLKQAFTELHLSIDQIIVIVEVAVGIAKLDKCGTIKAEHIAEAISYRVSKN